MTLLVLYGPFQHLITFTEFLALPAEVLDIDWRDVS